MHGIEIENPLHVVPPLDATPTSQQQQQQPEATPPPGQQQQQQHDLTPSQASSEHVAAVATLVAAASTLPEASTISYSDLVYTQAAVTALTAQQFQGAAGPLLAAAAPVTPKQENGDDKIGVGPAQRQNSNSGGKGINGYPHTHTHAHAAKGPTLQAAGLGSLVSLTKLAFAVNPLQHWSPKLVALYILLTWQAFGRNWSLSGWTRWRQGCVLAPRQECQNMSLSVWKGWWLWWWQSTCETCCASLFLLVQMFLSVLCISEPNFCTRPTCYPDHLLPFQMKNDTAGPNITTVTVSTQLTYTHVDTNMTLYLVVYCCAAGEAAMR